MWTYRFTRAVSCVSLLSAAMFLGQAAPAKPAPAPMAVAVISPEVHSDRTVTFRYHDDNAKNVAIQLEGRKPLMPMAHGDDGVWTLTTEPLDPENYGYRVVVDGVRVMDPVNANVRPNLQFPSSVVSVPGETPMPWEFTSIPHGELHHHLYESTLAHDHRDLWVYTPPGYDAKRKEKYPVLYLLHGYSDDASGWVSAGQANLIMDWLLQQGKIKPMVVVMPFAYGTREMLTAKSPWTDPMGLPTTSQNEFEDQMLHEILPLAETNYDIAKDADHRAIAGLSMGGGHTLHTGLNHPEVFGYLGAMSSAVVDTDYERAYAGRQKGKFKLVWISCGVSDDLITPNRALYAWLKTNVNGEVSTNETPGMHTWLVWRQNLLTVAPLLFTK